MSRDGIKDTIMAIIIFYSIGGIASLLLNNMFIQTVTSIITVALLFTLYFSIRSKP